MIRLATLPIQQHQKEKKLKTEQQSRGRIRRSRGCYCQWPIVVAVLLSSLGSVLSAGPHCNQVGHGPEDIIMASGKINPKYTWYKRGHKTYVPVVMDPTYSHKEHSTIVGGLNEIQEKTCVEFDFYDDEHSLQGKDYVYITRRTKRGCWSYIGRIGRGKQEVGLPPGCITHRTAMHEMMHALGFRHEHVRHDRDDYIIIFWGNIKPGRESNFQKRSNDISVGPYDYNSIMHYERKAFSLNNMDTIRPLKNGVKIGVRQKMSHWDAKKINIMYGCLAGGGGGGGGGHLSWSPEHDDPDHDGGHDESHLIDDSLLPVLPRNASSSPPASSEIEVAYDELDYNPGRSERELEDEPEQRSHGHSHAFDDEFGGSGEHNHHHHHRHNQDRSGHHPGRGHGHGGRQDHYDHQDQDDHDHPHSGHANHNYDDHNSNHLPPQSYSHFELDSYPTGSNGQGSQEDSDNVDFYDI